VSRPRYVVQTVTGFPITPGRQGSNAREGLSAHVCDTIYLHEVVKTYRSTDYTPIPGHHQMRRGVEGARAAAKAHAERLNRGTA
jgi:hypothetical protein